MQLILEIDKSTEDSFKDIRIEPVKTIENFLECIKTTKELPFKVPNDETIEAIKELENGDVKKVTLDEMQDMINV